MREIRTLRLTGRGLETGLRRSYTGTKLETADTAKGSLRGTAPALDPTSPTITASQQEGGETIWWYSLGSEAVSFFP